MTIYIYYQIRKQSSVCRNFKHDGYYYISSPILILYLSFPLSLLVSQKAFTLLKSFLNGEEESYLEQLARKGKGVKSYQLREGNLTPALVHVQRDYEIRVRIS